MLHFITKINRKTEHPTPPKIPTPYRTVSRVTAHPVNFISVLGSYCLQNLSRFQFSHFPLSGNSDEITFLPEAFRGIQESCLPLQEMYFSGIFSFFFPAKRWSSAHFPCPQPLLIFTADVSLKMSVYPSCSPVTHPFLRRAETRRAEKRGESPLCKVYWVNA